MTDSLLFKCDICGEQFEADPDCMLEAETHAVTAPEEGEEWKGPQAHPHPIELSDEDREKVKADFGWNDEQLDRALRGEPVMTGACICKSCQDSLAEESE
jgi:hypothetical protein